MRKSISLLCFLLFLVGIASAQGIFDGAVGEGETFAPFELNGYLRSPVYIGRVPDESAAELKSVYGEFSLKLKATKRNWGDAFAEIRFRRGTEFGDRIREVNLREGYVNLYWGPMDLRIGHQIIVWGRADGVNPTDNLTPKNMLVRSPNEDDIREGNFCLRAAGQWHPLRVEVVWVPVYRSSVLPTGLLSLPSGIVLRESFRPDPSLRNGALAFKANLELAAFDASVSYFNGFNPFPGLAAEFPFLPGDPVTVFPKAYRTEVWGADFSTTLGGSFGLRGEAAYKNPRGEDSREIYIPDSDIQVILGLDNEFPGDWSFILQYIGSHVFSFEELTLPGEPSLLPGYELAYKNRLLASQRYADMHSLSLRVAKKLMHEVMTAEIAARINLTSEELLIRPKLTYDVADALTVTVGGEYYSGPAGTLFDLIGSHLSAFFSELKLSF